MAIFRCKMCGGTLEINPGTTVAECEYCGTKQTLPRLNDDRKANLYDRANHFRRNNEFDKAMGIYEQILNEDNTDSEAYWSLVLCRYGIEYVEDPATHKRVPTVNRAQYTSIFADEDYKAALQYADAAQKAVYEEEAKAIDEIQKGILEISSKEEPFDVFICYKETDNNGRRTPDSVLATDLYHQLTQEGFKVFFSRITLEDKLGSAYEPYIFAALNSAKVMVALGTKAEYFNAVWVKNEWSRYLALIRNGAKKTLIPAYRDMDPYDLPEEFSHLQAQDMSKLGFMQDLIRGIKKITGADIPRPVEAAPAAVAAAYGSNITALLKRGNMALEDQEWDKADSFFEDVLNQDAECAEAYIGKLLAQKNVSKLEDYFDGLKTTYTKEAPVTKEVAIPEEYRKHVKEKETLLAVPGYLTEAEIRKVYYIEPQMYVSTIDGWQAGERKVEEKFRSNKLLTRATNYAKGELKNHIESGKISVINAIKAGYEKALASEKKEIEEITASYYVFQEEADKKATELQKTCLEKRENDYGLFKEKVDQAVTRDDYVLAIESFQSLHGYKNSEELIAHCEERIHEIDEEARLAEERRKEEARLAEERRKEEVRLAEERRKEEAERKAKVTKRAVRIIAALVIICVVLGVLATKVIIPSSRYNAAMALYGEGKYEEAIEAFEVLDGYKDSEAQLEKCYIGKYGEEKYNLIKNIKVGDTYIFGSYEQDNKTSNGKEEIEWIVIDKNGMSLLLISKYALDCQQYSTPSTNVTWETCSLRKWLNGTFVNAAFSSEEQRSIISSKVTAEKNPSYSTSPGNNTTDKVFLLSITEAKKYFKSGDARKCAPTDYAIAQGTFASDSNKTGGRATCWWWLRSPGRDSNYVADVYSDGSVNDRGTFVYSDDDAVRPALWINL